jgi:epoxyqueuosine reductase
MMIGMAENAFEIRLGEWAAAQGYGLAIADIGIVETVRKKLEDRRSSGLIDPGFFEENLTLFRYPDAASITGSERVVVVAVPSPIGILPVTVAGRTIDLRLPPTYIRYNATFRDVLDDMNKNALGPGAEAEILKAPLKSLAAHMGLAVYGRNNITYVPGFGSGHQLCGYIVRTGKRPVKRRAKARGREAALERCSTCKACIKACPTGAIREDRFLISAERCFTLVSESRSPIPSWAKPPKRAICLIGCMDCQLVCPENKGRLKTVPSGVEFTAEETAAVIEAGRRLAAFSPELDLAADAEGQPALASALAKFERLGMTESLRLMGRNIDYYLSKSGTQY